MTTCNYTYAQDVGRDIKDITQIEAVEVLKKTPPTDIYIFYSTPENWGIVNPLFWNTINKKLNDYKAHKELVHPVVKDIIENPQPISWYQEKSVVPWLVVGGFAIGVSVPVLIYVFARR